MTRLLSELLEAEEPHFQHNLRQLEAMAGHPKTDIRLTGELQQAIRSKIYELGLDGHDTTAHELYAALGQRLREDEQRFLVNIGSTDKSSQAEVTTNTLRALRQVVVPSSSLALKASVARKLLKANVPRKTMKALGYRSADSMLKHESVSGLYTAATLVESEAWHKRIFSYYGKLNATDFELREITMEHPNSARWQQLTDQYVGQRKQYVFGFKELGSVTVLPLSSDKPEYPALTTAVLVLHALNEIHVASSYLRLRQMQAGFGAQVQQVVTDKPAFSAEALGRPVNWQILHQFFGRLQHTLQASIFEPLLDREELGWTPVENALAHIEPTLGFWKQTSHLGLQDKYGNIASCNLTDLLFSHTNLLSYEQRLLQYFRESLRSELLLRYLGDEKPRQALLHNLQVKLAPEMATIG